MNDRELLYIKTIVETKSISQAAKQLFIAQPSLSQAVQKIENDLGTKLFIRSHDGIKLTYAGEKYYKTAVEILNIYNDFENEVTYINDLKKGRVTIGITSFLGTYLIPQILPLYTEKYPNIEILIVEENSTNLENLLGDAAIDFAIMHHHPLHSKSFINYDLLYKDPFLIASEKNHPLSKHAEIVEEYPYPMIDVELLRDEDFILMDKYKRIRQVSDTMFVEAGINPNIRLTLTNFETARRLASIGHGITLVPKEYIKIFEGKYPADYYFVKGIKNAYWDTCIATNKNMYLSNTARTFIEIIQEFYQNPRA